MKRGIVVLLLLVALPAVAWAQEFSNAELYQMIQKMERKFDQAIEQTNRAMAEAEKAKEEAALAKEEAARAKAEVALAKEETARVQAELAQIKAAASPVITTADASIAPSNHKPKTLPGLGASIEAVYMRPSRTDLDYAISDPNGDTNPQGRLKQIDPDYSGGFRFGLGYTFDTGTEIRAQYMQLDTKDSDSATAPAGGTLWSQLVHPDGIRNFTSADATYDFDHDVFDFSMGKWFAVGSDLDLRVEAGLRYANMTQKLDAIYDGGVSEVEQKNDFSGWGPRVGLGLDWEMGQGFNLFSSVAGSFLMGDFDLSYSSVEGATVLGSIEDTVDNRLVPVVEMRAGLAYAYQLENGMSVGAKVGYEWQNWFNMVTANRFVDDINDASLGTDTTDVSLDGFFVEGFVNF
jgi:hypothetical protein